MFGNITIIGDGAMGSVCAMLLCEKGAKVRMWGYDPEQLSEIAEAKENKKFLPGYKLPNSLQFEADDSKVFSGSDMIVSAVPCQFMRSIWERLKKYAPADIAIVSVSKGIENKTLLRPTEILTDVLGRKTLSAALSGPTIADELARKLPATALVASINEELAKKIQLTFNARWFRVYTNSDVIGVELAGAMKNVIAIAAGVIDGIGAGDNAKAALLSRGLAEISRLGIAMGAHEKTFSGLSGLGDLVTTCISPKGRNRSFGEKIGKGLSVSEAQQQMRGIVEGIATCASVVGLAKKYQIEMPITDAVYQVLFEGKSIGDAIAALMARQLKPE